jgi:citrate synthase
LDAGHVYKAIDALPVTAHPMTQFTTGVMALQVSLFFNVLISIVVYHQKHFEWNTKFETTVARKKMIKFKTPLVC